MYRAYIRTFRGEISEKTNTPDRAAAEAAFAELVGRSTLDGQKLAAALTYQNRQIAFHRFDRAPGDADYWRDRLDELDWPQRGRPVGTGEGRGGESTALPDPTPEAVRQVRIASGQSQTDAAAVVHAMLRGWQGWEAPAGSATPTAIEIRAAREAAGLTQTEAAALVYGTLRAWQGWEAAGGAPAARRMHPGLWELYLAKTGLRALAPVTAG